MIADKRDSEIHVPCEITSWLTLGKSTSRTSLNTGQIEAKLASYTHPRRAPIKAQHSSKLLTRGDFFRDFFSSPKGYPN
jgi:hypothetical protein